MVGVVAVVGSGLMVCVCVALLMGLCVEPMLEVEGD